MRILFFSRRYTGHDRRFLEALAKTNHEVCFLALEQGALKGAAPVAGVEFLDWEGAPDSTDPLPYMPAFERILSVVKPDLVHSGPIQSCSLMTALADFHPHLAMSWGSDLLAEAEESSLSRWKARFALSHCDLVAVDCNEVASKARAVADLPSDKIVQFPWGVDLRMFSPEEHTGEGPGMVALSTRAWEDFFGIRAILRGFALAQARIPGLRLVLLGQGSLKSWIEEFIEQYGLAGSVQMPGQIDGSETASYFRAASIYVSCTQSDGSSISLLEALACGLPAIATDRASNREWITPDVNGWLVPFGNDEAVASALVKAATLTDIERERVRRANRKLAEERADWSKSVRKLLAAYERLTAVPVTQ